MIEVTLTVAGIVVTGILAAEERFTNWSKGVHSGAAATDEEIPPLGAREIRDRRSERTNQPGKGAITTDTLFLRNAYILTAPAAGRFSFFLVEIKDVDGFAFGYRPPRG
jgi:antitoxin (DNA-binding transcriptional repressor) of toxin-antitoxin stability system